MAALASQNGKTIYTTIYPGQRLVVRWCHNTMIQLSY
jgi:hypothetical protein